MARDAGIPVLGLVVLVLLALHFLARPFLADWSVAPDLLAAALLLSFLRLRPVHAVALAFGLGVLEGAMALAGLGALAISYAVVAYVAVGAWNLLFSDTGIFMLLFFFAGAWVLIVVTEVFSSPDVGPWFMFLEAPAAAILTAVICVAVERGVLPATR